MTSTGDHGQPTLERGNCYEAAAQFIWGNPGKELVLCHGEPLGQGPIEGLRHGHAWVEEEVEVPIWDFPMVVVHDVSNGREIRGMPAVLYYYIGKIDQAAVQRYTRREMNRAMVDSGHYGPWPEIEGQN